MTTTADLSTLRRKEQAADVPRPRMRWATRVLLPVAMLLGVLALLGYAARGALTKAVEVRVVPVVVKTAGAGDGGEGGVRAPAAPAEIVQAPGWIEPDPYAIGVPALVEGVVEEVLVLEGERIEAGQVVARLIDDDLKLAERTAAAMVSEREAELARARSALESMRAQERVHEASIAELKDEVERKRKLVEAGGVSEGEFRRMEIRLTGLDAQLQQARSASVEAGAAMQLANAALETAKAMHAKEVLHLERTEVRAPASGVVMMLLVAPGSRVPMESTGGNILRLYDPAKLQVRVDVPISDAAKIGVGTPAQVTSEALPDRTFMGRVTRVVHEADIQRNTVQFKVALEDPPEALKPEMLCRVRLSVGGGEGSSISGAGSAGASGLLVLPESAVRERSAERGIVWLAGHTGEGSRMTAQRVAVALGGTMDGNVVVLGGVKPGDRAIVDASAELREGVPVRIIGEGEVR